MELTIEDFIQLGKFRAMYPDWWYKIGVCYVSWDFDCAPQAISLEIKYAKPDNIWDNGFSHDSKISLADAIENVTEDIEHQAMVEDKTIKQALQLASKELANKE